jgi:hypothetical protein
LLRDHGDHAEAGHRKRKEHVQDETPVGADARLAAEVLASATNVSRSGRGCISQRRSIASDGDKGVLLVE